MGSPAAAPNPPPSQGSAPSVRTFAIVMAVVVLLVGAVVTAVLISKTGPFQDDSVVDEALAYIPDEATVVEFRDQLKAEERLGIDDVKTGADDAEVLRYRQATLGSPWIDNDYTPYLDRMNDQETAFTAFDVDWSASVTLGSPSAGSFLRIYRMDADLDLDRVADEMVDAGWDESDVEGGRKLEAQPEDRDPIPVTVGGYPDVLGYVPANELVLLPDEHLMVAGDYEQVLDVIAGESESLATSGTFRDLLHVDDAALEYAYLTEGSRATCTTTGDLLMFEWPSPELVERIQQLVDGLQIPRAAASLVLADGDTVTTKSRLLFDDEEEAAEDAKARETYLREGSTIVGNEPIADVLDVDSISVDGAVETIDFTFERGPSDLVSGVLVRDLPPTFCLV